MCVWNVIREFMFEKHALNGLFKVIGLHKFICREIDDMIKTVDKNEDGKISYSEFRVRFIKEIYFNVFIPLCI